MDKEKLTLFLENSFLHDLLLIEDITDISYNGKDIYYVSNTYGRAKSEIVIEHQEVKDFLRQIANFSESQFSYLSPILDLSFGRYRINAVHQSIARIGDDECVNFSIRIASEKPKINDKSSFFNKALVELFQILIYSKQSIVIAGPTGSGKTEFQKYLISLMPEDTRVIVIDNVLELENVRNNSDIDLSSWKVDDKNDASSINLLVRNALRSNPDWLIVAEARGKEMNEVLNSAMTGVPIITTLHAFDIYTIPNRIISMVMMSNLRSDNSEVKQNVDYHFHYYVYLTKEENSNHEIVRYISKVAEVDNNGNMNVIYQRENNNEYFGKIRQNNLELLRNFDNFIEFKRKFIGENA